MNPVKYPIRVHSNNSTLVVEFTSMQEGTVVVGDGDYLIGGHDSNWVRWDNAEVWHPLITTRRKLHEAGKLMVRHIR